MKKQHKLLLLLSLLIVGCGSVTTNPSITPSLPSGENGEVTTSGIPTRPNDFLDDPDRVEGEEIVVDTAPEDDGELKDYVFEFEAARYEGSSNGENHMCTAKSLELNTVFGGNVCMKNIGSGASFVFTFNSDKQVRSPLTIKCSNAYKSGQGFSSGFTITVNGHDFIETSIIPEEGVVPDGLNKTYFTMVDVTGKISIQEGLNTLKFTSTTSSCPNMDSLIISTSAQLEDKTKSNWPNMFENCTINTMPTETEQGNVTYRCNVSGCSQTATRNMPALNSGLYHSENTETSERFSLLIGNSYLDVIAKYLLKLQKAKFSDGSTQMKVAPGSKPALTLDDHNEGIFSGWTNVDDLNETYPTEFVMPNKSLTIKPLFEALKQSKLTLVNATFSDGSSEKMVTALEEVTLNVTAPSGKKHVGWYDVNSPSTYYETVKFTMPNNAITIAPVFKPTSYVTSGTGFLDIGESSSTSTSGYADYVTNLTFVNGSKPANRKTSHAGNGEYGTILNLNVTASDALFRMKTTYSVVADKSYEETFVLYNFSDKAIELTLDQINTGTETVGNSKIVTLQPNSGTTVTLTFTFNKNNNNLLTVFRFSKAVGECTLGVTSSITQK